MRTSVRWSRLWAGLVLVVAAIVLLVVENRAGIVTQPSAGTPTPRPTVTGPVPGMAQSIGPLSVNVKLLSRVASISGLPARPSVAYQEIAVLVVNHGQRAARVGAGQFSLHIGSAIVACVPFPGHPWLPADPGILPGKQAQGVAVAAVPPGDQQGHVIFALPAALGSGRVGWRVP
jgi:hypothetical protein